MAGRDRNQTCALASDRMRAFINRRAVSPNRAAGAFDRTGTVFAVARAAVRSELSVVRVLDGMEVVMGASGVG
jgi:hypothetical protein